MGAALGVVPVTPRRAIANLDRGGPEEFDGSDGSGRAAAVAVLTGREKAIQAGSTIVCPMVSMARRPVSLTSFSWIRSIGSMKGSWLSRND